MIVSSPRLLLVQQSKEIWKKAQAQIETLNTERDTAQASYTHVQDEVTAINENRGFVL